MQRMFAQLTELRREIGARLKELRRARGLTQREVARRLDLQSLQVSRWERGYNLPRLETLRILCALYDTSEGYVLTGVQRDAKSGHAVNKC